MMTLDLRKVEIKIKKDMNKQVRLQAAYLKSESKIMEKNEMLTIATQNGFESKILIG